MKTLLKLPVFAAMVILIAIGCQKNISYQDSIAEKSLKEFNTTSVKEWYYGTFKKSPEWLSSKDHGKKLPDWKNGVVTKIGKWDAVVYPLNKLRSSFSLPGDIFFTTAQCKKVANASLSKILFIKVDENKIVVREIDYVPDWEYLQNKNFDIGEIKDVTAKADFTGRMSIKKWDGSTVSTQIIVNGNTIKTGKGKTDIISSKHKEQTNSLDEDCTVTTYCIWLADCVAVYENDEQVSDECGEWYNSGECWTETDCSGSGDEDPCETYGIGCGGGGGTGGEEEEGECNMTAAQANEILAAVTIESINGESGASTGQVSAPDVNGIIRKPVTREGGGAKIRLVLNIYLTYRSNFTGVLYKNNPSGIWKWESFSYSSFTLKDGVIPPCFSVAASAVVSTVISPDKLMASATGNCTITATVICLGGYQSDPYNAPFSSNHPSQ